VSEELENPIKKMRIRHGLTLAKASMAWGVHRSTIVSLEEGNNKKISDRTLSQLADALIDDQDERDGWTQDLASSYVAWRNQEMRNARIEK
jgi:DNA-binding XRE family transcriptional regulator